MTLGALRGLRRRRGGRLGHGSRGHNLRLRFDGFFGNKDGLKDGGLGIFGGRDC